jgi:hypothetical protein
MGHDEKNDDFDPVRSDGDVDEDAPERDGRLWVLSLIGFLIAFGPSVFLSLNAKAYPSIFGS